MLTSDATNIVSYRVPENGQLCPDICYTKREIMYTVTKVGFIRTILNERKTVKVKDSC